LRAVLTWHSIDDSGSVISTSRRSLERQLDALARQNVRVVPLGALHSLSDPEHAVALTFDDGFENFSTDALPLLAGRGFTATVFVVSDRAGMTNDWDPDSSRLRIPRMKLMSWEQLRGIGGQGIDIGGHSSTHRALTSLEPQELVRDVTRCADVIAQNTGSRPAAFAFPYGAHDRVSVEAVSRVFPVACTTEFATVTSRSSVNALPRLDMFYFRDPRMLEDWGSLSFRAFVALRNAGRRIRSGFRY
jgi:peptidoglycan/xylan/chitin deacetylase (PgdA/CDA1 family)